MKNNISKTKIRSMIRESINSKKHKTSFKNLKLYEARCMQKGYPQELINEGIMDYAKSIVGNTAFVDSIKRSVIESVMEKLGLDVSNDQVMNVLFSNIFEALDFEDVVKMFGSGKCDALMKIVTEGIIETVTELGSSKILGYLSGMIFSDMSNEFIGPIIDSLDKVAQESINEVVVGLIQGILQEPLKKVICDGNLTDFMSSAGGGLGDIASTLFGGDMGSLGKNIMGAL